MQSAFIPKKPKFYILGKYSEKVKFPFRKKHFSYPHQMKFYILRIENQTENASEEDNPNDNDTPLTNDNPESALNFTKCD